MFSAGRDLAWEQVPRTSGTPRPRKSHSVVLSDSSLYVFGGIDNNNKVLEDFYRYDLERNVWYLIEVEGEIPTARYSHVSFMLNNVLYVHGGISSSGEVLSSIFAFDFETTLWSFIQAPPLKRFGHYSLVHQGKVFIFGGCDGVKSYCDVLIFDPSKLQWTRIDDNIEESFPEGRTHHSVVAFDNSFYIYGGCLGWNLDLENNLITPLNSNLSSNSSSSLCHRLSIASDCFEFQLETKEWRPVEVRGTAPKLYGHTSFVIQDSMVIVGGDGGEMAEPNSLNLLNFVTTSWTHISSLAENFHSDSPLSRRFHCSSFYKNSLYIIFGESGDDKFITNSILKLSFPGSKPSPRSASLPSLRHSTGALNFNYNSSHLNSTSHSLEPKLEKNRNFRAPFLGLQSLQSSSQPLLHPNSPSSLHSNSSSSLHSASQPSLHSTSQPSLHSEIVNQENSLQEPSNSQLCFKCYITGRGIRLLPAPRHITFSRFIELLENCLLIQYVDILIRYKDDEGDMIVVKTQSDFEEAIYQAEQEIEDSTLIKVYISKSNGDAPEMIDSSFSSIIIPPSSSTQLNFSSILSTSPSIPPLTFSSLSNAKANKTIVYRPLKIDSKLFRKGPIIGSTIHSKVYLSLDSETGNFIAIKALQSPFPEQTKQLLKSHVQKMSKIHQPNLVQYFGIISDDIYLEYVPGGSLLQLLTKFGSLSEIVVQIYTHQILLGLEYLHSQNLFHGGVKCSNILLDQNGVVKLSDYLISSLFPSENGSEFQKHKDDQRYFSSPFKQDIWDLGLAVLDMLTGEKHSLSPQSRDTPLIPESVSPDAQDFLMQCFYRGPDDRPTSCGLLLHSFLNPRQRTRSFRISQRKASQ